jgi:hypothetical protein
MRRKGGVHTCFTGIGVIALALPIIGLIGSVKG